jgi:acyl dehydratase
MLLQTAQWLLWRKVCFYSCVVFTERYQGLLRGLVKRSGTLQGEVSEVKLQQNVQLNVARVELYERSTVFAGGKAEEALSKKGAHANLSICFPQVLSVQLSAGLIVSRGFPMSPLGIVHIQQSSKFVFRCLSYFIRVSFFAVTQHRSLPAGGDYVVEVFFARYPGGLMFAETDKGVDLTIRVSLSDRRSKELFWEGDTVVLSRAPSPGRRGGPPPVFETPVWDKQSQFVVKESTGRTYAKCSGDFNPHHLFWWTALPVGFRRPIAHGMWTLSAALHELEAQNAFAPDRFPLRVTCDFKKPLLMPASVTFGFKRGEQGIHFGVYDKSNSDPHLIGLVHQK